MTEEKSNAIAVASEAHARAAHKLSNLSMGCVPNELELRIQASINYNIARAALMEADVQLSVAMNL